MKTTTNELARIMPPLAVDLSVCGSMDDETRKTVERLAYAIEHQHPKCDAIGECSAKCSLAFGHPGEIHEQYWYR